MASADFEALKSALRTTIAGVEGIGKVETRVGGIPTWVQRQGAYRAFWEIGVQSASESHYAASDCVFQDPLLQIEAAMPFSYEENTEAVWLGLVRAVCDAIRANPSLKVEGVPTVTGGWAGFGLPQLVTNDIATYRDGTKDVRVHHCLIQVRYRHDFDYEAE
jgi:hypothetical protein